MIAAAIAACLAASCNAALAQHGKLWEQIRGGGHVVLIRHAIAPGTGDPANFRIGDCSTQRNLSEEGRRQARRIGERFRRNGINQAQIFTSQWCRCRETARLLGLGKAVDLPPLNSFFGRRSREAQQMKALRSWLAARKLDKPLVLVTHQVNITSFTGVFPASGEMVVMRRKQNGGWERAGTIETGS